MAEVSKFDDVIDSRDVIERLEELEAEREALVEALEEAKADPNMTCEEGEPEAIKAAEEATMDAMAALAAWEEENEGELAALRDLAKEGADYSEDWSYGSTLVRDSYFKEYAQELADDIGAVPDNAAWPLTCIDWEQAARELKMDYTSIEFDGVTYWVR